MKNQLLQAAKHALEFIQSIDGYENSTTANELRSAVEAVEQMRATDECLCSADKKHFFKTYTMGHVELCEWCGTRR